MARNDSDNQRSFWSTLFRRNRDVLEITEPYQGDLDTDQPLRIAPGVTLQGNVRAPEVWVAGLLQGYVLTPRLCVNAGGQLRGDVVAVQVEAEPEGKIRGRLTMLSPDQYQVLNRQVSDGTGLMTQAELRSSVVRLLVTAGEDEVPPAKADERVDTPGESTTLVLTGLDSAPVRPPAELMLMDSRAQELQKALDEAQAKIMQLESYQRRQERRPRNPEDARERLERREAVLLQAEEENRYLEQKLNLAIGQVEELTSRAESLESALQASVQHGADQEEALLRWQELAETTRSDARRLESEVERLGAQLDEREREVKRLQQALAAQQEEQRRVEATLPDNNSEILRLETRLIQLEHLLEDAQDEVQEQQDQLLWYRTSLTAIEEQLQTAQGQSREHEEEVAALGQEVENQRAVARKWQDRAGHLSELLYDATQQLKAYGGPSLVPEQLRRGAGEEDGPELATLRRRLREREAQVESLELEVARYRKELEKQGQRLAEVTAELAEREMALKKVREQARLRDDEVQKLKRVAATRIRKLEAALTRLQRRRAGDDETPS